MTAVGLDSPASARVRVRVSGLVQGVGFRPFVFSLANRYGLTGWVHNDDAGVLLEIQGDATESFLHALRTELPPLARIDDLGVLRVPGAAGEGSFDIRPSAQTARVSTGIGPDAAPCLACLAECFDPGDRRYRYPFLNCTHCGPRFTITRRLPYDRAQTSMSSFPMCAACESEYHDPHNRRFHAQPTACPACGPRLTMPVEEVVRRLRRGEVVALKGLGGFHIACDATNHDAVARLRRDKQRDGKPFALLVAGLPTARTLVELDSLEAGLLQSIARPIVVARRRDGEARLAPAVAPDLSWLGVMLPSSPLHYLLFHEAAGRPRSVAWLDAPQDLALVMTSANRGGEPLVTDDAEAHRRLAGICDAIVGHDRAVVVRCDDPVMRVVAGVPMLLRRGRGFVPEGITLALGNAKTPSVLATGGFLKSSVCVTRGNRAYLSQHVGDLDDAETYRFFEETIDHLKAILDVDPVAVAHDLHPDFLSTSYAERLGVPRVPVQHHHAHVAAVLAEHGREGSHLGLALDGVGLGDDGEAWGGEVLRVDGARFARVGHLAPLPLPGGDAAARAPWRMAVAALWKMGERVEIERRWGARGAALVAMLDAQLNTPATTGCGRWFDAACGLLGIRDRSGYEGEAPMVLESLVRAPRALAGGWRISGDVLDLLPLLDALRGMTPGDGADVFHGTLAAGLVELAMPALGTDRTIALGGGCVANAALSGALVAGFAARGVETLLPRLAPAGDGGLALGQAWVCMHAMGGD